MFRAQLSEKISCGFDDPSAIQTSGAIPKYIPEPRPFAATYPMFSIRGFQWQCFVERAVPAAVPNKAVSWSFGFLR
jgi:hypothetical protein